MSEWQDIATAPKDRPIAIVAQCVERADQEIFPDCWFDHSGGGVLGIEDDSLHHLAESGLFATHWAERIEMPSPRPPVQP